MGITTNCVKFLCFAKTKDVDFSDTLMLGRQQLFTTSEEIGKQFEYFGIDNRGFSLDMYAEPLFKYLGASVADSMDLSDYEGATIIHDLNEPIPLHLRQRYSVVFDGGTLEHVYNFPLAIKNCMQMLKVGGTFLSITPANNQCGHGFYQFSPELFFSLFKESAGFKLKILLLRVQNSGNREADWYTVQDPHVIKKRVTLTNSLPTYLLVMAEKLTDLDQLDLKPFQSDYEAIWKNALISTPVEAENMLRKFYRKTIPVYFRNVIYTMLHKRSESFIADLGYVDPDLIRKFKV